jgi:hypothetical protein
MPQSRDEERSSNRASLLIQDGLIPQNTVAQGPRPPRPPPRVSFSPTRPEFLLWTASPPPASAPHAASHGLAPPHHAANDGRAPPASSHDRQLRPPASSHDLAPRRATTDWRRRHGLVRMSAVLHRPRAPSSTSHRPGLLVANHGLAPAMAAMAYPTASSARCGGG